MLVLARRLEETIKLKFGGVTAVVTVLRFECGQVVLGFDAPRSVTILRDDVPCELGANPEKLTEDIGSGPGCVLREDARRIIEWRDDIDNTVFPVDLQSAACRLAAAALKDE